MIFEFASISEYPNQFEWYRARMNCRTEFLKSATIDFTAIMCAQSTEQLCLLAKMLEDGLVEYPKTKGLTRDKIVYTMDVNREVETIAVLYDQCERDLLKWVLSDDTNANNANIDDANTIKNMYYEKIMDFMNRDRFSEISSTTVKIRY